MIYFDAQIIQDSASGSPSTWLLYLHHISYFGVLLSFLIGEDIAGLSYTYHVWAWSQQFLQETLHPSSGECCLAVKIWVQDTLSATVVWFLIGLLSKES